MDRGPENTISLSESWQSDSRGARLGAADFETKLYDRTNGNPLCAILVLPIAHQAGIGRDGSAIADARYPLYAPVAVDRETLMTMLDTQKANIDDVHQTLSGALEQSKAYNNISHELYMDDYASGSLTGVARWSCERDEKSSISVGPAANQQQTHARAFSL